MKDNLGDAVPARATRAPHRARSGLGHSAGIAIAGRMLERVGRLFRLKPAAPVGFVHIHRPPTTAKSLTRDKCIDCKQDTIFVGIFQDWYGWTETCIRCGRQFAEGEWLPLDFCREARRDNIKAALEQWGDATEAKRIHRVKAKPASCDTHPKGGDADAAPFMSGAVGEAETPQPQHPIQLIERNPPMLSKFIGPKRLADYEAAKVILSQEYAGASSLEDIAEVVVTRLIDARKGEAANGTDFLAAVAERDALQAELTAIKTQRRTAAAKGRETQRARRLAATLDSLTGTAEPEFNGANQ